MLHNQAAGFGRTLTFALLFLFGTERLGAQTDRPDNKFEQRFFFEQRVPQDRTAPSPRPAEQKGPAGILKNLIVPPAEAEPAPAPPSAPAAGGAAPRGPAAARKKAGS